MIEEPLHLEPDQFDLLVSEVLDELPREWAPLLDNMAVVVEDEPTEDDLPAESRPDTALLGRYRGGLGPAPLIGGGLSGPPVTAPPEIALFQGPLERASSSLDDLRLRVRETLIHEIGHYFGYAGERPDEEDETLEEDDEPSDEEDGF